MSFLALPSCEELFIEKPPASSPVSVFDELWNTINDKYTFFDFKQIDWYALRDTYRPQAAAAKTDKELFKILRNMLNELRDNHVNLVSPFDISRARVFYWSRSNFNQDILEKIYLQKNDKLIGPFRSIIIQRSGKRIGYIRYPSFALDIGSGSIDYLWRYFEINKVSGLIIDIRSNGGGNVHNVFTIASRLTQLEGVTQLIELRKDGPNRNQYKPPNSYFSVKEGSDYFRNLPVAVLTDRGSYSASSMLAAILKSPAYPHVRLMGDHTGGGSGIPSDFQLPNGWIYRFSATKTIIPNRGFAVVTLEEMEEVAPYTDHAADAQYGYNYEQGVPVDIKVSLNLLDRNRDEVIEAAIEYVMNN